MAQDPITTDPDKYTMTFENDRVRVLEYHDKPGAITTRHRHPDSIVYALGHFKRRLILGGGKTVTVEKQQGEVYWVKAQEHIGLNIGTNDTHVLIIELKEPPKQDGRARPEASPGNGIPKASLQE
ncbi:MAG: cytoplasmic protein [Lentisphaerae bacterium]|nr:cytoplasmic protein [Lentisphaerota bacterium]